MRRNIVVVSQEPSLFAGTIKDNLLALSSLTIVSNKRSKINFLFLFHAYSKTHGAHHLAQP